MGCSNYFAILLLTVFLFDNLLADRVFYLKAPKNGLRVGRRSTKNSNIDEMGKFFMKASKSVPRIGRRNENIEYGLATDKRSPAQWFNIPDEFEYDPEILFFPELTQQLDLTEDSAYEWAKLKSKRDNPEKYKSQHFM